LALALGVTAAGVARGGTLADDARTSQFRGAGQWLQANAPADAIVGAFSAGLVGWYAPARRVVNLDGLINTRRYLDEVLRPGRLADYFDAKGIGWFADYAPIAAWRNGIRWQGTIPAQRLVPRRYARIDGVSAYAIWQVLPRGDSFPLLGARTDVVRDRYVELAVAADVHGRHAIVPAAGLDAARRERPDHVVARSLLAAPEPALLHVLVPRDQLAAIAMTDTTVHPSHRLGVEVAPGLVLLGHDQENGRVQGTDFVAVTLFWSCRAPQRAETFTLTLRDDAARDVVSAPVAHCHGTLPLAEWLPGFVVPETVVLPGSWRDTHLVVRTTNGREIRLDPR
jgi:hypothetical protein